MVMTTTKVYGHILCNKYRIACIVCYVLHMHGPRLYNSCDTYIFGGGSLLVYVRGWEGGRWGGALCKSASCITAGAFRSTSHWMELLEPKHSSSCIHRVCLCVCVWVWCAQNIYISTRALYSLHAPAKHLWLKFYKWVRQWVKISFQKEVHIVTTKLYSIDTHTYINVHSVYTHTHTHRKMASGRLVKVHIIILVLFHNII